MRTLLLLRHAKSSWNDPGLSDHERPLAPRGQRAARRLARYIESHDLRPELVLCSSAQRTRQTLETVRPALGGGAAVDFDDELYGADADALLGRLRCVSNSTQSVMLVGHNPGLHDLATRLAGDGDPLALARLSEKFPSGALAVFDVRDTWARLSAAGARLTDLVFPGELPDPRGSDPA